MNAASPDLSQLKSTMKSTWMAGNFGEIAKYAAKEGENFVARLGLKPGQRVLDVACGTGNTAIPAARTGANVIGVVSLRTCSTRPGSVQPRKIYQQSFRKETPRSFRLKLPSSMWS